MAVQHILNDKGEPTHVVMTMEEWQGFMSSNANKVENTKSDIEIPEDVQEEVLRRKNNIGKQKSYSLQEVKEELKKYG